VRFDFLVTRADDGNAIEQATVRLAQEVERAGHETRVIRWNPRSLANESDHADVLVLPYNPFMWGRWGFAPKLVRDLARVRRLRSRPILVLVVHEPYVPIHSIRSLGMGLWQRVQLGTLVLLADRRFASIEPWAKRISKLRPTDHLPSGSNLPDARVSRAATRAELDIGAALVVATLSTGHPSHLVSYVEASLAALSARGYELTYLRLGAGAAGVVAPPSVRIISPGRLPDERLAALVAASDLFLAPFVDGASTRRTSFMAGLCEQVAVVSTRGALTDPMLLGRGLELVEVGNPASFAKRVTALAADVQRRTRAADAGRELFESEFTPDVIARRLLASVGC
jgi:glycosyltransferase involved in cell wall biosynthesis